MKLLAKGSNSKLGRSVAAFSIPAIKTCPGATQYCQSVCYANKGCFRFPNVISSYDNNYKISLTNDFVDMINKEIKLYRKLTAIRIHPSGDFYNIDYIEKWIEIVKANPKVKFWAYTRSWRMPNLLPHLKTLSEFDNIELFASTDSTTSESPPSWLRIADVQVTWDNADSSYVKCPAQKNKNITCDKCTYCFKQSKGKQNVIFKEH